MPGDVPREFALIERHFRPLAGAGARGLADDAAVLDVPAGRQLVVSADAMVEGVHWLAGTDPGLVARKLLRVNLSDLAAMGALPLGYLLTVSVAAGTPDPWFAGFAAGLASDQALYEVRLLGGDSTATPGPASLSLTILGTVTAGAAIGRDGALVGDGLWVSGTLGDGALGLAALRGELADPDGFLAERYHLPSPRMGLADGIAAACIDVSDGLMQELSHLCRAGNVGASIESRLVPLSAAGRAAGTGWRARALAGGDDYELLMAVRPERSVALMERAAALGVPVTRIGVVVEGPPVLLVDGVPTAPTGWSHFA